MMLDERKMNILKAIIDDYINTAEPVGSRTIARKHELGLSSATIRNEMADLEEMGFLEQPHTSAGRVPSDKGYRLYVDRLMKITELTELEMDRLQNEMEFHINELNQLLKQASGVMSRFTKYTSMAVAPRLNKSILKAVQVVPVEQGKALVVVVTNAGVVRNCMVKIPDNIIPEDLIRISNALHDTLSGYSLEQINLHFINELQKKIGIPPDILYPVLSGVSDCINQTDNTEVYLDGATNIFNHPEFRDVIKAREFLNIMDEKESLLKLLHSISQTDAVNIVIGSENPIDEIKDCSLVTVNYRMGNGVIGSIGIIGPTRMEYSKVISSLEFIRKKINKEISKFVGE